MNENNPLYNLKYVYSLLSDDISKEVFIALVNYYVSGSNQSIDAIVTKYLPDIPVRNGQNIKDLLESISCDSKIVLYGAGKDLDMNIDAFLSDSRIIAICDADKEKQGRKIYGYPVISPEQLIADPLASVIISSHIAMKGIKQFLLKQAYPENLIYEIGPYIYCADDGQYFDVDFWKYDEENGEVFIDDGCCNLQSTLFLGKYCKNIKKVYAFEPDPLNYKECNRIRTKHCLSQVELIQKGTWSSSGTISFSSTNDGASHITEDGEIKIDVTAIDDVIDPNDRVTLIKMDVEGAELESLKGAEKCIKRDRPKLAICIYHKPEDLYELPLYIKSIVPEYKLYIRHHSNIGAESVLYATL